MSHISLLFLWHANHGNRRNKSMNKKGLAILMRARFGGRSGNHIPYLTGYRDRMEPESVTAFADASSRDVRDETNKFRAVREWMHSALNMNNAEINDTILNNFSQGYSSLSREYQRELLLILAKGYDLNRTQASNLMKQYLGFETTNGDEEEANLSAVHRIERNLRKALKPTYEILLERLNNHPGGLKFLSLLRADILSILEKEHISSLRALDGFVKEKLSSSLNFAALELHQITWDCPASLLEKIVVYEAVHPISNLIDLKRRLGVGRRCFGYFHSALRAEPLIFIEVALVKDAAKTIQEVLWDEPPIDESLASCALFYSISSTQPGFAGINLGKFLIKRVISLIRKDMPHIDKFATLSPIPGFMQWLLSKLGCPCPFQEKILQPEEEASLTRYGENGTEALLNLLTSTNSEWTQSDDIISILKPPLMRLCARYLALERKRGKALDAVANFHLQNGAMIEDINWLADRSSKGFRQSGGIMVNYVYKVDKIEEFAKLYSSASCIHASNHIRPYFRALEVHEESQLNFVD